MRRQLVYRKELTPSSPHRWEMRFSSFGAQTVGHSASMPTIGFAGDRGPDVNRGVTTRTGLSGRAAPILPFSHGAIPRNHFHQRWGDAEAHEDWRDRAFYAKVPPYLRRIQRNLASQHAASMNEETDTSAFQTADHALSPGVTRLLGTVSVRSTVGKPFASAMNVPPFRAATPACCTYGLRVDFVHLAPSPRLASRKTSAFDRARGESERPAPSAPRPRPRESQSTKLTVAQQIGWTRSEEW
jgi:hypothetical protein